MKKTLTPTMKRAIGWARANGGRLIRHPSGYWAAARWEEALGVSYQIRTIQSLVDRGLAEYTAWTTIDGDPEGAMFGKLPSEVTLTDKAPEGIGS